MSKNEMKVKSYRYRQRRVDECYDMIEEQERLKQVIDVTQIMQIICISVLSIYFAAIYSIWLLFRQCS